MPFNDFDPRIHAFAGSEARQTEKNALIFLATRILSTIQLGCSVIDVSNLVPGSVSSTWHLL